MDKPEGEGWMPNVGVPPAWEGEVYAMLRTGRIVYARARRFRWNLGDYTDDILWWKPEDESSLEG